MPGAPASETRFLSMPRSSWTMAWYVHCDSLRVMVENGVGV